MARRVPPLATLAHRRLFHFSLLLPLLLILSLLLCFSAPAHASHFRFVSFRWRPDPSNQRTAIITMTLAFRRSYFSPAPQINNTIDFSPSNNDVRVGYSTTRCPNRLAKVSVINTAEDWVLGEFTCSYTYPGTSLGPFRATWSGNARIDSLKNAGGANWDFYTDIVLGNLPPTVTTIPIVPTPNDQILVYTIPAFDPEGQPLTFTMPGDCGYAASKLPAGLTLSPDGVFTWDVRGLALGMYTTCYHVSDGANVVTVDFIFNLHAAVRACTALCDAETERRVCTSDSDCCAGTTCANVPNPFFATPAQGRLLHFLVGRSSTVDVVLCASTDFQRLTFPTSEVPPGASLSDDVATTYTNTTGTTFHTCLRRTVTWAPTLATGETACFAGRDQFDGSVVGGQSCWNFVAHDKLVDMQLMPPELSALAYEAMPNTTASLVMSAAATENWAAVAPGSRLALKYRISNLETCCTEPNAKLTVRLETSGSNAVLLSGSVWLAAESSEECTVGTGANTRQIVCELGSLPAGAETNDIVVTLQVAAVASITTTQQLRLMAEATGDVVDLTPENAQQPLRLDVAACRAADGSACFGQGTCELALSSPTSPNPTASSECDIWLAPPYVTTASLEPSTGSVRGGDMVAVRGSNFSASAVYEARFTPQNNENRSECTFVSEGLLRCGVPPAAQSNVLTTVAVRLYEDRATVAGGVGDLQYTYIPDCPPEGCVKGTCVLYSCRCQKGWTGVDCNTKFVAPQLPAQLPALELIEKVGYVANSGFESLVSPAGTLRWSLSGDVPNGMEVDALSGILSWDQPVARPIAYAVEVRVRSEYGQASATLSVTVLPAYTVTNVEVVSVNGQAVPPRAEKPELELAPGASVLVRGQAVLTDAAIDANAGANGTVALFSVAGVGVDMWLARVSGNFAPLVVRTFTANDSSFQYVWRLPASVAGRFKVGASHPAFAALDSQQQPADQSRFLVLDGAVASASAVAEGVSGAFSVTGGVRNIGDRPLTLSNTVAVGVPVSVNNVEVLWPEPLVDNVLAANATVLVGIAMEVAGPLVRETFYIHVKFVELPSPVVVPVIVRVADPVPVLRQMANVDEDGSGSTSTSQPTTVARGQQKMLSFSVKNIGAVATAAVLVSHTGPAAVMLQSPNLLAALEPNASTVVALLVAPPMATKLDTVLSGSVTLKSGEAGAYTAVSLTLHYSLRVVGSQNGVLRVQTVDEFTILAPEKPPVVGAAVTLTSAAGSVVARANTDAEGNLVVADLLEGYYTLKVQAPEHTTYSDVVLIQPGDDNRQRVFLPRVTVKYVWTVTPKTIEETYTFTLTATYVTNVPIPVVVVEPALVDLVALEAQVMAQGQASYSYTATNHGLIRADSFELHLPQNHPTLQFDVFGSVGSLAANSSVVIPVLVSLRAAGGGGTRRRQAGSNYCGSGSATYEYECDGIQRRSVMLAFDSPCSARAVGSYRGTASGSCSGCRISGSASSTRVSLCTNLKCPLAMAECLISFTPLSCAYTCGKAAAVTLRESVGKAIFECVFECLPKPPWLDAAINVYNCYEGIGEACFPPPMGGGGGGGLPRRGVAQHLWNAVEDVWEGGAAEAHHRARRQLTIEQLTDLSKRSAAALGNQMELRALVFYGDLTYTNTSDSNGYSVDQNALQWLSLDDGGWFARLAEWTTPSSADGLYLSVAECANLTTSPPLRTTGSNMDVSLVEHFCRRWNNTMKYYDEGITRANELPRGYDANFLAADVFEPRWHQLQEDVQAAQPVASPAELFPVSFDTDMVQWANTLEQETLRRRTGTCAEVKVQIEQPLTLTRTAFVGSLQLTNTGSQPMENIFVRMYMVPEGQKDFRTNNATHLFVIGDPDPVLEGGVDGAGRLDGDSSGRVEWLFMALPQAAPTEPVAYDVGGILRYSMDGVQFEIPLYPDTIVVVPAPSLVIKYFWETQVFGDNPFTSAVIEPSIPFTLGLLVFNDGAGPAERITIGTSQPQIIENKKGLLVDFKIVGAQLNYAPSSPSLQVQLGSLQPRTSLAARWEMVCPLMGDFVSFNASMNYVTPLGDVRLSAVDEVSIHPLVHVVRDVLREDGVPDFLTNDVPDLTGLPDTLHSSQDNSVYPVKLALEVNVTLSAPQQLNAPQVAAVGLDAGDTRPVYKVVLAVEDGVWAAQGAGPAGSTPYCYVRADDTLPTDAWLARVYRGDLSLEEGGLPTAEATLDADNYWRTRRTIFYDNVPDDVQDYLHVFDVTESNVYTLVYVRLAPVSNVTLVEAGGYSLTIAWTAVPGANMYRVQVRLASQPAAAFITAVDSTAALSAEVKGLELGREYELRVLTGVDGVFEDVGTKLEASTLTAEQTTTTTMMTTTTASSTTGSGGVSSSSTTTTTTTVVVRLLQVEFESAALGSELAGADEATKEEFGQAVVSALSESTGVPTSSVVDVKVEIKTSTVDRRRVEPNSVVVTLEFTEEVDVDVLEEQLNAGGGLSVEWNGVAYVAGSQAVDQQPSGSGGEGGGGNGDGGGAVAGAVVGGLLAAIVLVAGGVYLYRYRQSAAARAYAQRRSTGLALNPLSQTKANQELYLNPVYNENPARGGGGGAFGSPAVAPAQSNVYLLPSHGTAAAAGGGASSPLLESAMYLAPGQQMVRQGDGLVYERPVQAGAAARQVALQGTCYTRLPQDDEYLTMRDETDVTL